MEIRRDPVFLISMGYEKRCVDFSRCMAFLSFPDSTQQQHQPNGNVEDTPETDTVDCGDSVKATLSLVLSTASSAAINTSRIPKRIDEIRQELFSDGCISFTG